MKSFLVSAYIDSKILENLPNKDFLAAKFVCKSWANLIEGLLYKRQGKFVPLDVPPDWDNERLESAIAHVFSPNPRRAYKIQPINHGFSNWSKAYKLTVNEHNYVIKYYGDVPKKDLLREISFSDYFGNINVAPNTHYISFDKKIIIIEYINDSGSSILQVNLGEELLNELAESLRSVHQALPVTLSEEIQNSINMTDDISYVLEISNKYSCFDSYSILFAEIQKISSLIQKSCFCHNDLHTSNILYDGNHINFIDWELSGTNDPFLDLSIITAFLRLNDEQELFFLTSYFTRKPSDYDIAKNFIFKQLNLMKYSISFLAKITDIEGIATLDMSNCPSASTWSPVTHPLDLSTDFGKYFLSMMLLKETVKNMQTSRYEEAFHIINAQDISVSSLHV